MGIGITDKSKYFLVCLSLWMLCCLSPTEGNAVAGIIQPLNEGAAPILEILQNNLLYVSLGIIGGFFVIQGIAMIVRKVTSKKRPTTSNKVSPEDDGPLDQQDAGDYAEQGLA